MGSVNYRTSLFLCQSQKELEMGKEKIENEPAKGRYFYYVDDIQRLLEPNTKSAAYTFIRNVNNELKKQGFFIKRGTLPKDYFDSHYLNKVHKVQDT